MKRVLSCCLTLLFLLPLMPAGGYNIAQAEEEIVIVTSEGRELKHGDSGDDVSLLQTRLKDLGYYQGPVSGNFLEVTRKAINAVQEAYGLEATGIADLLLQELIYGDAHRPLQRGSKGKDVSRLQTRLSELGFYWGKISGDYLDGTTAAVGNFQEDNGIVKSGKADVKTLMKLYSDDIVMPTPDPAATPVPVPTPQPDAKFSGVVSYGAKDNQVKLVQQRLTALGFFDRKITGGFYEHTSKAVKAFQSHNGLVADGVVGETTWNALFSTEAVHKSGSPKPTPAPTPIPYAIDVDINNQLIKVYGLDEFGQHTRLDRVFTASTGTEKFPSDVGTFTLSGRKARWAEFPNWGGGKARWWVRINGDIAFHSVIYNSNSLDDVNMSSVRKLGSRASHGCIRLTVADAKWIYDNIGAGTVVRIHEDAPLDPELKAAHKPGNFNTGTYLHNPTPAPTGEPTYLSSFTPEKAYRSLKPGSEGEDVFWLQSKLKELGYYKGTVTGAYLDGTKAAVKAFQKDNRLSSSGNADIQTLDFLYEKSRVAELPFVTPLPTDPPVSGLLVDPLPSLPPVDFAVEDDGT
jgi:peptidoglycan hydrolase-like protein with peptidoglycan-binding domain